MRSTLDNSSFKTKMEPEKLFKNSILLYIVISVFIIPLFTGLLYLAGYPEDNIYVIFAFFISLVITLVLTKFSKFIKKNIIYIITIFLFFSILSFFILVINQSYQEKEVYRFLISYSVIILSLRNYKNVITFFIATLILCIIGLSIYTPSYSIIFLITSIIFFSSAMAILLSKRWYNIVRASNKETYLMSEILNNSGIGYIILDKDLSKIIDSNKVTQNVFGSKESAIIKDNFEQIIKAYHSEKKNVFELDHENQIYEFLVRNFKSDKNEDQLLFKFFDVTKEKTFERLQDLKKDELISETQKKLQTEIFKLKSIYEHSPDIFIWNLNKKLEIIAFNEYFKQELIESIDRTILEEMHFDDLFNDRISKAGAFNFKKKLETVFETGKTTKLEGKLYNLEKAPTWYETYITPIFNHNKEVVELVCISHNTTEKRLGEVQTKELVAKQEILLQEIHHRVKNNLQVISSILNLQTGFVKDGGTLEILKESQNRIKSMSYIHESLYMNKDFSSISFKDYILNLTNNLVHSYQIFEDQASVVTELEDFHLGLDESITCGLLLNEIISNALKHAFPVKSKENRIKITAKEKEGIVSIAVMDNGVGFKKETIPEENSSLGMQLIYTLIEQLDGNIVLSREEGVKYLITFEKQN